MSFLREKMKLSSILDSEELAPIVTGCIPLLDHDHVVFGMLFLGYLPVKGISRRGKKGFFCFGVSTWCCTIASYA